MELLRVKDLRTYFYTPDGVVKAVDGVSLLLSRNEVLGIVGESGSGKSVLALSIMRLVSPPGRIVSGEVVLEGKDLLALDEKEMQKVRGSDIAMIFQDPMTSLNPVFTVGSQIMEAIILHQGLSKKQARKKAIELLRRVGVANPEKRIDDYPHQFSGGMRQRVMIAMALSCNPKVLIADEPTTALDVTIQAQILGLMNEIRRATELGILMITHDLGVIAGMADNVAIMYAGKVVEYSDKRTIFYHPAHPYTWSLLRSIPKVESGKGSRLVPIEGYPPSLINLPQGCAFSPRCRYAKEICFSAPPGLREASPNHLVACYLTTEEARYAREKEVEEIA